MDEEVEVSPEGLPMMEEETKYTSERINVLEEELQKERELRKDLEDRNGKLRFTIAELQKELTSWKEGKGGVDVAIQTSEEEATGLNSSIGDTRIPEKIDKDHPVPDEAHSIADSLRDAAEAAMTHSGFVYDENSGLYYDYSSGYYYNPENHLYYDTKTGIYYYFNETSNAYEFHSQVEMPDQSQTWQQETEETEGKNYNRRKKYRENRRKDVKEKYRHKNEKSNQEEIHDRRREKYDRRERKHYRREEMHDHREKRRNDKRVGQSEYRRRDEKRDKTHEITKHRKDKKYGKSRYENVYSSSDEEMMKRKHSHKMDGKAKRKDKKGCYLKHEKDASKRLKMDKYMSSGEDEKQFKTDNNKRDRTSKDKTSVRTRKNNSGKSGKYIDIIVISSDGSEIEEGEIGDVEDIEDGEIPSNSPSRDSSERSSLSDISTDSMKDTSGELENENEEEEMEEEIQQVNRREYPPCIRMIVTKSESIPPGSLYIITCMGGSIGREGSEHAVVIPETGVSKRHADIYYSQESWQYFIRDLGSQNGTLINSKSLSQPRTESESHSLSHKDYLTIGGTVLRLHIHPGAETCDDCEPGQVQALLAQNQPKASVTISADKEQQRRKGLKEIRKKYGLAKDNYVEKNPSTCNPLYKDRAEGRRKTVGSDNPHQKDDAPSSVDREIASDNLGRKMMEKMGWKSGDTLGKDNTGIKEPINVLSNNKRAGLGGQAQRTISDLAQGSLASEKWDKARARYDAIAGGAKTEIDQEKIMEIGKGSAQSKVKSIQMNWTSGGIMKPQIKKENIFGIDEEEEEEAEDGPVS
ncbi:angiogenic factor with G patch and FHA domains 1-like isoform X1 [Anneissia japonica]|uniref:angiogenic factor with G patch and FHA domains 1-like isoform X1 n=1 Tax=Anneissia japonica TaxID=1529436 RepID=UPI0014257F25|nr:angiogenic factor with G patch and FHA domains 1-like isoform X1 [Anneissia japonica]XP_033108562.1 angiogenic factor with G patch and FHA domains 1-like isoform X1 [Anneissia japonica]